MGTRHQVLPAIYQERRGSAPRGALVAIADEPSDFGEPLRSTLTIERDQLIANLEGKGRSGEAAAVDVVDQDFLADHIGSESETCFEVRRKFEIRVAVLEASDVLGTDLEKLEVIPGGAHPVEPRRQIEGFEADHIALPLDEGITFGE